MSIRFPSPLKKGDKIAVVSPAGAVEQNQISTTVKFIENKGYRVVLSPHCFGKFEKGYPYSGTEIERISDLNWAFNNDEVSAIWATRGGYGCQHLLKHLKLNKFRKKPKWYIGYSDNTVIQSFLLKNGFASIHGQTLKTASFGVSEESYQGIFDILAGKFLKYKLNAHQFNKNGLAEGVLAGGNLALIYALLGTPYSFDFRDKILFIEDIGEQFYSLDRMLISLDLAGVFRKIKGVIIGGMTNMGDEKENANFEKSFDPMAYEIVAHRLKKYNIPTAFGFPNGHIFDNQPLILGAKIYLKVNDNQCEINYI
ncbi:MAG: LD-carboxypeptidase [Flavobacteriaceae bacterium]|nr:LD-carboxypeptidase [Flavobacteriaceae bacterium]